MTGAISRSMRRLVSAGVVLASVVAAQVVLTPSVAQAQCYNGSQHTTSLWVEGTILAEQRPVDGTCNNNNYYQGTFRSKIPNLRARVVVQNGGQWKTFFGERNTALNNYYYHDNNSNSLLVLCVDNEVHIWCGHGGYYEKTDYPFPSFAEYVTNQGF